MSPIRRMPTKWYAILFIVTLMYGSVSSRAQLDADPIPLDDDLPLMVKIHADWCGDAARILATWSRIERELGPRVHLIVLDVSTPATLKGAHDLARRWGLEAFLNTYATKPATVAILAPRTHAIVATLKGDTDFSHYSTALDQAYALRVTN